MYAGFKEALKRVAAIFGYFPDLSLPESLDQASLEDFRQPAGAPPNSYEWKRYWAKRSKLAWKIIHMLEDAEGTKLDYVGPVEAYNSKREEGPHFRCPECGGDIVLGSATSEEDRKCKNCGYDLLAGRSDQIEVISRALNVVESQLSGP